MTMMEDESFFGTGNFGQIDTSMNSNNLFLHGDSSHDQYDALLLDNDSNIESLLPDLDLQSMENLHPQLPPEVPSLCNEPYEGPWNFQMHPMSISGKRNWEYSQSLNRIYINMKQKFAVKFSLNRASYEGLYIRATPVYKEAQHVQEPVRRCLQHQRAEDPSNQGVTLDILEHTLRSHNPGCIYLGHGNPNGHHNVVIPLGIPEVGSSGTKESFQFVCQTSCAGGMNRRPIEIIFTLEDQTGEVMGRAVLGAKICAGTKRDKRKDESKLGMSNGDCSDQIAENDEPPTRRARLEPSTSDFRDNEEFSVNFPVVGKEIFRKVVSYGKALTMAAIYEKQQNGQETIALQRSLEQIQNVIDNDRNNGDNDKNNDDSSD